MDTKSPTFSEVWSHISALEGEEFETKTGKPFTFEVHGDVFRPSRTNYNIAKSDFEKAFALVPFDGPGVVNDTVRGPAYIWAVLHDRRVRKSDW